MKICDIATLFYKQAELDLMSMDITPDNIEDVLSKIFTELNKISENKDDILQKMKDIKHGVDNFHKGESILEHTKEVLQNIQNMSDDINKINDKALQLLKLTALFHDIGKVYTLGNKQVSGTTKITFNNHAKKSAEILQKLIEKQLEEKQDIYEDLQELVALHDTMLQIIGSKSGDNIAYIKSIINGPLGKRNLIEQLKHFIRADTATTKAMEEALHVVTTLTADLDKYTDNIAQQEKLKEERKAFVANQIIEKKEEILGFLKANMPSLIGLYPDINAIRAGLEKKKRYDLILELNKIIPRK